MEKVIDASPLQLEFLDKRHCFHDFRATAVNPVGMARAQSGWSMRLEKMRLEVPMPANWNSCKGYQANGLLAKTESTFKSMTEARRMKIGRLNGFKLEVYNMRGMREWSEHDSWKL